jgi:hypothetical protein
MIAPRREAAASERRAWPLSEFQRPGLRKESGPFCFFFHFGCAPALRRRIDAWRTRRGMCAAGNPPSCSETPPPTGGLAWGHSRSGRLESCSSSGEDAGFSTLQRGFVQRSALDAASLRAVRPRRSRAIPAHGAIEPKSLERSRLATQTGRNDWAAPEPVTGTFLVLHASLTQRSRVPACPAGGRGFESRTRRHQPKSPERSRFATQTGRNDWAAPEPVTGTFCFCSM